MEFGEKIKTINTLNNKSKKAGALNQAFAQIDLEEFVLIMDADIVLDTKAIEEGIKMFNQDFNIGAVCSKAGVLPYEGKSKWEKLIWGIQHIEYAQFDSDRIEKQGNIKVAHGMCTMFKAEAIKSAPEYRKQAFNIESEIFLEDSLVEDYELTLCLKHNWKIYSCLDMLAWTDVPIQLRELWIQRKRWLRGGVDALRDHSFNKVTAPEVLNHWLFIFLISLRIFALTISVVYIYISMVFKA